MAGPRTRLGPAREYRLGKVLQVDFGFRERPCFAYYINIYKVFFKWALLKGLFGIIIYLFVLGFLSKSKKSNMFSVLWLEELHRSLKFWLNLIVRMVGGSRVLFGGFLWLLEVQESQ